MIDGMTIRKHVSYDQVKKQMTGYVDYGSGGGQDESKYATEVLCFLAVGVRGVWKLPIGYYLINGKLFKNFIHCCCMFCFLF